jgi:hypothetical protein
VQVRRVCFLLQASEFLLVEIIAKVRVIILHGYLSFIRGLG